MATLENIHDFQICEFLSTFQILQMSSLGKNFLTYRRFIKEISIEKKNVKPLKKMFSSKCNNLSFVERIEFGRNTCTQQIMKLVFNKNIFSRLCELDFSCAKNLNDKNIKYIDFSRVPNVNTINLSCNKKITYEGFVVLLDNIKKANIKKIKKISIDLSCFYGVI